MCGGTATSTGTATSGETSAKSAAAEGTGSALEGTGAGGGNERSNEPGERGPSARRENDIEATRIGDERHPFAGDERGVDDPDARGVGKRAGGVDDREADGVDAGGVRGAGACNSGARTQAPVKRARASERARLADCSRGTSSASVCVRIETAVTIDTAACCVLATMVSRASRRLSSTSPSSANAFSSLILALSCCEQ
jgi:hypothetical protein